MQSRWWDFGGDAIVRTDKYVLLHGGRQMGDDTGGKQVRGTRAELMQGQICAVDS